MFTRRQFLIGAGAVLATVTGCSRLKMPSPVGPSPADPPPAAGGPRPFRIALLSDTHAQDAGAIAAVPVNGKISRAVADLTAFSPDLWLCNGDVSDHGLPGEYAAFRKILLGAAQPDQLLVTTGNHEFYDKDATDDVALRRFREMFGLPAAYTSHVAGGVHLVLLADEQWKTAPRNRDWAWITPEQLRWFEQVLAEHRTKPTAVFLHQPLQETVAWSFDGNDFAGCGQAEELRAILRQNAQVKLWFSGHTHLRIEADGQTVLKEGVTYACLGSTFYQFRPSPDVDDEGGWPGPGGYKRDLSASQSRVMEVWPDRLLVRTRDHAHQTWMDDQEIVVAR
jgi:hypothetical protein